MIFRASRAAQEDLGAKEVLHLSFPTNDFWLHRQQIWEQIRSLENRLNPDLIFTQTPDEHQDHVILFQETIRNFYSKTILHYKPSIRNGLDHKWNWIERLDESNLKAKLDSLRHYHQYQHKVYFDQQNITSQARVQAMNVGGGLAEGFTVYRVVK